VDNHYNITELYINKSKNSCLIVGIDSGIFALQLAPE